MKTKEFIRQLIDLGFINEKKFGNIVVYKDDREISLVESDKMYGIVSGINDYQEMPSETQQTLFNLFVEYARTPIEERKEEKKYYLRHKHLAKYYNYLNYDTEDSNWSFSECGETFSFKTKFTLAELPDWVHEMIKQGHLLKEEVE